jgi:hypothetical protein
VGERPEHNGPRRRGVLPHGNIRHGNSFSEGNYNKRKNTAMKKLHQAIAATEVDIDPSGDVTRVGGACWSDLIKLSTEQLQRLDADLDEYRKWFLDGFIE